MSWTERQANKHVLISSTDAQMGRILLNTDSRVLFMHQILSFATFDIFYFNFLYSFLFYIARDFQVLGLYISTGVRSQRDPIEKLLCVIFLYKDTKFQAPTLIKFPVMSWTDRQTVKHVYRFFLGYSTNM